MSIDGATGSERPDRDPAIAYGTAPDQFLVVWSDARNEAARGYDVFGRRVNIDRTFAGRAFRVSGSSATTDDLTPDVEWAGRYLVVWDAGEEFSGRAHEVFGRRVRDDGSLAGGAFRINETDTASVELEPAVAWSGSRYLVVWSRTVTDRGADIYGRRVRGTGALAGGDFRVSGRAASSSEWFPAVAANRSADQVLVVWEDGRGDSSRGEDIYGRRVAGRTSILTL